MYGFALQDETVWYVDAKVEQGLCNRYALNNERETVCGGLEAMQCNEANGVEKAERDDIMQEDYASSNEVELSLRRSDHCG